MVAFGFAFDIFSGVHSLSMPSACCGSASFRIVFIRQPAPQFIPIAFRIAVAFRFAFDMFTFVSYFRRFDFHGFPPQIMPPAAHGIVSPSVSSAPCTRLRCLWHCFASLHLAHYKIPFRVRFVPLLFDLRQRIVSFRLPCLQLHSTSTFSIHLVARSCALREGE
jgi:hypothetical protein